MLTPEIVGQYLDHAKQQLDVFRHEPNLSDADLRDLRKTEQLLQYARSALEGHIYHRRLGREGTSDQMLRISTLNMRSAQLAWGRLSSRRQSAPAPLFPSDPAGLMS